MQRTARLPDDTKLVLSVRAGQAVRDHGLTIAVFVLTTALAGIGVGATGSVVWAVIGVLCFTGVVLELLLVRAQAAFGPLLAADSDHVWVRTGGFLSPRSVRLDWPEINTVTLHLWRGRRKVTARYLAFDLTDDGVAQLSSDPRLARRADGLTRAFGAPIAIAEPRPQAFDQVLRELRDIAPDGVRFTEKT